MATEASITHGAVSVGTSETQLCIPQGRRTLITFTNNGLVTVYLGGPGVTASAFLWPLASGETMQFTREGNDVSPTMKWYGITASSTASVSVGEVIN